MIRAYLKLALVTLCIMLHYVPLAILYHLKQTRWQLSVAQSCYWCICMIIGLKVVVRGQLSEQRPLLVVSNHVSYLDIVALGKVAHLTFTPKSEIGGWPGIGTMCRMVGCVFIDRSRARTADNLAPLDAALDAGHALTLFAEGTTGDGKRLLPLRSSFFKMAEAREGKEPVQVQPVKLTYTRINNLPIDSREYPRIAWIGDVELLPHLLHLLTLSSIELQIDWLVPIKTQPSDNRKEIAKKCELALRQMPD